MPDVKLVASVHAQDQLLIQRQLGDAIRGTYETLTLETLPDQISLLLLQLALTELIKLMRSEGEGRHRAEWGAAG